MRLDAAVGKIREYEATPQRLAVLRALAEEPHRSAGDLRRVDFGDGPRYELAADHRHYLMSEREERMRR